MTVRDQAPTPSRGIHAAHSFCLLGGAESRTVIWSLSPAGRPPPSVGVGMLSTLLSHGPRLRCELHPRPGFAAYSGFGGRWCHLDPQAFARGCRRSPLPRLSDTEDNSDTPSSTPGVAIKDSRPLFPDPFFKGRAARPSSNFFYFARGTPWPGCTPTTSFIPDILHPTRRWADTTLRVAAAVTSPFRSRQRAPRCDGAQVRRRS